MHFKNVDILMNVKTKGGSAMRSVAPMKTAKTGYVIISAALCVLGILLIAAPKVMADILGIVCGILLILFGAVKLVGYFSKDLYRLAFQYDLTLGIISVLIGAVMLIHPGGLMTFICITMGLFILTDGLLKIQIAIQAKNFGIREWWEILVFAVATGILGFILMFRPGDGSDLLMIFLGVTLLFEGILNFCTVITSVKIIKNQRSDNSEDFVIDYYEESEEDK